MGTISLGGHVLAFQSYDKSLYVAIKLTDFTDRVNVFDQQYVETHHWLTNMKVADLAISNGKVYLCSIHDKIHVFSTSGTPLYEIEEGGGTRVASHPIPNILMVTNHAKDRVCCVNGETQQVLWSAEIEKPWGIAIDEYETVWVWSEFEQGVTLFDDKGMKKQR